MAGALKVASETGAAAALGDAAGLEDALVAGGFAETKSTLDASSSHTVESGEATRFPAAGNCCAGADDRPEVSALCGGRLVAKRTTVSAATSTQRASSG